MTWRFLLEPAGRAGAANMALDCTLLDEAQRTGAAWLRLYRWDPPCLSLGRNESARARYDRAVIERLGLDVVRRPTGGRAVWHEHELTYAVAAPVEQFGSLRDAYRSIHRLLASALRALGVEAEIAPDRPADPPDRLGGCFAAPVGGELLAGGRKLVGSAQLRQGTAFLQHGSILLDGSQETVVTLSRQPSANGRATTLREVLGRPVAFAEVAAAVLGAWSTDVTSTASYRPLPPSTARFSDPEWTWRR